MSSKKKRQLKTTSAGAERKAQAEFIVNDVRAGIIAEVRRCVARAFEQASILESIASESVDAAGEIVIDDTEYLARSAHRLRGAAVHGMTVIVELEREAARMEALAAIGRIGIGEDRDERP